MRCKKCKNDAVLEDPQLCKDHFLPAFEAKVYATIDKYKLLPKNGKVLVACSGGKDSTVLLHLLAKRGYHVTALAIDEGIKGYRPSTLRFLRGYCKKQGITLKEVSYKETFSRTLDAMLLKRAHKPCHVCGVFRRYLLNKHAANFPVLATGHNLDDEAQSILMNLLLNNSDVLIRLGPRTGIVDDKRFTTRIKPLYLCREKEVMAYSFLNNLLTDFTECPNIVQSFRAEVRDFLNRHEQDHPGFKKSLVDRFLGALPRLRGAEEPQPIGSCSLCDGPSARAVCSACSLRKELKLKTA